LEIFVPEFDEIRTIQIVGTIDDQNAGPSYSVVRLAESLSALAIDSSIFSLSENERTENCNGVKLLRFKQDCLDVPLLGKLGKSSSLNAALKSAGQSGSIFHNHGFWRFPNVYPGLIANQFGVPFIVSPRGMLGRAALEFSSLQKKIFWAGWQSRAMRSVSCFHATALSELDDIRQFGLKTPVAVIPNGIDVPDMASQAMATDGMKTVLCLGRIHPKKGLDRLLAAWKILGGATTGWRLRLIGPSELGHTDELRALAQQLGLNNVEFREPVHGNEKSAAYAEADLFVLPTLHENFGMVVAESLAQGTPVICTVGAPWQGLAEHGCGWWIEHGPEPMAVALAQAMSMSDEQRQAMGQRGRSWMTRDFAWKAIAEKMTQLYRWCKDGGETPEFVHVSS
jgi:glycosyltransferase involved in cell wall biosynthesis